MYVDRIMTRDVVQDAEDTRLPELAALMRDHHIRHLPVVREGGQLVGLVTSHDLERVSPSPITTLSVGEANYLLGKLTAARIMRTQVVTCAADTLVEEAARLLRQEKIGCLPVVENGKLAGILTHEDLLDFFLDITGCLMEDATRIAVHLPDTTGQLGQLLAAINQAGGYIATVVSPLHPDQTGLRIVVVRYRAGDPRALNQRLRDLGYDLLTETLP